MGSRLALGERKVRDAEGLLRAATLAREGCIYTLAFHCALAEKNGSPLLPELERELLSAINTYRFTNPGHTYGLLGMGIPESAARLLIYICLEKMDAYPIVSFIRKNGISPDLRNYSIEYAKRAMDNLAGEPDIKELLRICALKSLPEELKSYMGKAMDSAMYVCSLTNDEGRVSEVCASPHAPESALRAAIELCREKKWAAPLEVLIARKGPEMRGKGGKPDEVLSAALRARKSIGGISEKSLGILRLHGLHRVRGLQCRSKAGMGGASGREGAFGLGSRRVAAQRT